MAQFLICSSNEEKCITSLIALRASSLFCGAGHSSILWNRDSSTGLRDLTGPTFFARSTDILKGKKDKSIEGQTETN